MSKDRSSNFELLKIVATIMVISLHYLNRTMGGAMENTIKGSLNYYLINFLESFCIIAVNCFFIITGYFMIEKNKINLDKPIKLMLISFFYGGLCYVVGTYLHIELFSIKKFVGATINFYDSKWFVWSYIVVYCLSPYMNRMLNFLNEEQYRILIMIQIVFFSAIPTFFHRVSYNDNGYGILSFIMFYCIGGYIKKYYTYSVSIYIYLIVYIVCSMLTCRLVLNNMEINVWWRYNSIINVISTIGIFLFFKDIKLKSNIVNYIASYSFMIYLIHSDTTINRYLFRDIFNSSKYWNHPYLFINMSKSIVGIFLICIIIDAFRRILVKIFFDKMVYNLNIKEISV